MNSFSKAAPSCWVFRSSQKWRTRQWRCDDCDDCDDCHSVGDRNWGRPPHARSRSQTSLNRVQTICKSGRTPVGSKMGSICLSDFKIFKCKCNPWYWCAPCYRLDFNIAFKISVLNKAPQNLQSRGHKSRCVCGTAKRAFCLDCFGCVPCLVEGSKFSPFLSSFEHFDLLLWDAEHALHPLGPASKTCGRHPNERAELKARPVAIVLWLPCSWYRFYTRWKGLGNISGVMLIHHFEGGQAWDKAREAGRSHSVFTLKLEASNTTSGGVTSTKVSRCRVVSWNALSSESVVTVVTVVTVVPVVQAETIVTLVTLGMLWSRYVVAFSLTGWIWST